MADKPKIYIAGFEHTVSIIGQALAEDGVGLGSHASSHWGWFEHDMGLASEWKHDRYREHYPDGYELVRVDDPATHEGWQAALKLYRALNAETEEANTEA